MRRDVIMILSAFVVVLAAGAIISLTWITVGQ